jgi:hypothetical protein
MFVPISFFLQKLNDALMKLFYFSYMQNGLRTRNKHQIIFLIDNLYNLVLKWLIRKLCKKN